MIYELLAYNTDSRYPDDVRHREYTSSKAKADRFDRIPKIQFTDSGHGIVFSATPHRGKRQREVNTLRDYIQKHTHA